MRLLAFLCLAVSALLCHGANARTEIEIDLTNQRAYLIEDGDITYESPICSGRSSHPTPTGLFKVTEKDIDHRSTLYGKVVDARGRVVKADADVETPVPKGGKFVRAPMRYFLRFNGAVGMHAGILPGYPASHGCVRLPSDRAAFFYEVAQIGTPVRVYGKAPYRGSHSPRHFDDYDDDDRYERGGFRRERYYPEPPRVRRLPFFFQIF